MRRLLFVLAAAVIGTQGGLAQASTAETQSRLARARPVATRAVTPPPPPVTPDQPTAVGEPLTKPPRPELPSRAAPPPPKPAQRHNLGLILLLPTLIAQVALVRWFARRRQSGSKRV